ncbi:unnamed protein product [Coregonus sp. 'balchen']|nr:unnamed protein product [Coregonus sp. 'balchen']
MSTMATINKRLHETLEELVSDKLKRFQWHLVSDALEGIPLIPRSQLENADREDTVNKLGQREAEQLKILLSQPHLYNLQPLLSRNRHTPTLPGKHR